MTVIPTDKAAWHHGTGTKLLQNHLKQQEKSNRLSSTQSSVDNNASWFEHGEQFLF